jgi:hypothetical protein
MFEARLAGSLWVATAVRQRMVLSKRKEEAKVVLRNFPGNYWQALFAPFSPELVSSLLRLGVGDVNPVPQSTLCVLIARHCHAC